MTIEIKMPALSPTMTEGKLAKWLKSKGDTVKAGDVIAEIETDKATMEVEAVDEGKLAEILVPEGTDGVKVNTPIALLQGEDEKPPAAAPKPSPATPAPAPVQPAPAAPAAPANQPKPIARSIAPEPAASGATQTMTVREA
ncbi:MAG TPA: biotin/lipoyl-containing protein, partial [Stellaceae bacterium]|nr:biotin/lipoyl-containing protein [Stellaceae bacterium]